MEGSKLDDWPCYNCGHRFRPYDIGIAYQKILINSEAELKCRRCGHVVNAEQVQNPVVNPAVTTATMQRAVFDSVCSFPLMGMMDRKSD